MLVREYKQSHTHTHTHTIHDLSFRHFYVNSVLFIKKTKNIYRARQCAVSARLFLLDAAEFTVLVVLLWQLSIRISSNWRQWVLLNHLTKQKSRKLRAHHHWVVLKLAREVACWGRGTNLERHDSIRKKDKMNRKVSCFQKGVYFNVGMTHELFSLRQINTLNSFVLTNFLSFSLDKLQRASISMSKWNKFAGI